jgi:hypothetical protein
MLQKEYKIYRLVLDGKVVYVGQTTNKYLSQRKAIHHYDKTFERVRESIIELIEVTTDKSREHFWIEFYKNEGCKLFNKYKGDTGLTQKEYKYKWQKEYRQTEKYKEYQKTEKYKEYKKEWERKNREQNREKINKQQKIRRAKKK